MSRCNDGVSHVHLHPYHFLLIDNFSLNKYKQIFV